MRDGTIAPYRAYVLRCWQESGVSSGEEPVWRFSVEEVGGEGRRRGFGDLEGLMAFLRTEFMEAQREG